MIKKVKKVLFVCIGNMGRSPIAEALFNKIATDNFIATSAGTNTKNGHPAGPDTIKIMKEYGINIANHKTRKLDEKLLKESDYVICMEKDHLNFILNHFPSYSDKYLTLRETDIIDLYKGSYELYRTVANDIEKGIQEILHKTLKKD
jgi:protein-tyrosine-phosphatase